MTLAHFWKDRAVVMGDSFETIRQHFSEALLVKMGDVTPETIAKMKAHLASMKSSNAIIHATPITFIPANPSKYRGGI